MTATLPHLLLACLALPVTAACLYLLVLTLRSSQLKTPARSSRTLRFDVIVPAHNEAALIARCLASLRQLDWPAAQFRLLVVADNCDDATAEIAAASGAQVLVRTDPSLRSKGYALRYAFDHSHEDGAADAVVVIDADTLVSSNLLEAFAARIEGGASAMQAHYGVLNPGDSWRTGLISIAHGAFHSLRSQARERMGLSCGIRGNGWCVTLQVLQDVTYRAYSVTEDLEYGIALGLAGYRVHYVGEAHANADMESGEWVARRQRQRWEDGRFALIRSEVLPLLRCAALRRSRVCLDLALDLLVLPLSYVALGVSLLLLGAAAATLWDATLQRWLWLGLIDGVALSVYVLRGWQLSGRGAEGLRDLLHVPYYIVWKLGLLLQRRDHREWVPTKRRSP